MIATWMLYCVAIAAMLGAAAHAGETILRSYGRPGRWVWALATIGSLAIPLSAVLTLRLVDTSGAYAVAGDPTGGSLTGWPLSLMPLDAAVTLLDRFNPLLAVFWVLASITLGTIIIWSGVKLSRDRRGWRRAVVGSVPVFVSPDAGPAVVGVVREDIVVPEWVLALSSEVQTLIARHEEQHVRAGDARLLVSALCVVLLVPWNVALWWQLRRLRLAVEADCDRRVLESGADVDAYGNLLIEMGRRSGSPIAALAFSLRRSLLSRRIELMIWKPRFRFGRAVFGAALGGALVFAACETPLPPDPETSAGEGLVSSTTQDCELSESADCSAAPPLYLLDGVEIRDRDQLDLESLAIERVEVLKGATATEIYGKRGAGGVISIFTDGQPHEDGANEAAQEVRVARQAHRVLAVKAMAEARLKATGAFDGGVHVRLRRVDSLQATLTKEQLHEVKKRPR